MFFIQETESMNGTIGMTSIEPIKEMAPMMPPAVPQFLATRDALRASGWFPRFHCLSTCSMELITFKTTQESETKGLLLHCNTV